MHVIIMCYINITRYAHFMKAPPRVDDMLCSIHETLHGKSCYPMIKQSARIAQY